MRYPQSKFWVHLAEVSYIAPPLQGNEKNEKAALALGKIPGARRPASKHIARSIPALKISRGSIGAWWNQRRGGGVGARVGVWSIRYACTRDCCFGALCTSTRLILGVLCRTRYRVRAPKLPICQPGRSVGNAAAVHKFLWEARVKHASDCALAHQVTIEEASIELQVSRALKIYKQHRLS